MIEIKPGNAVETFEDLPDAKGNHGVVYRVAYTAPDHFTGVGGGCNHLYTSNGNKWVPIGYTHKKEATNE